ncbi:MAG: hypothetical protein LBS21_13170 [Clostridiales bacterium]|jgi:hypothetical protein|nr:hypothetical protein [Clostridiales bacterium]
MSTNLTATFPECANYALTATKTPNELHIKEIMQNWNCSSLEASASLDFECETLKETQDEIAKVVTYERLQKSLLDSNITYFRNKFKGLSVSDEAIQDQAVKLTEEQAEMFVYSWEQFDDYAAMSEEEKEAAIYGNMGGA